jgi:methyl-accepting chemotaxis protein
MRERSATLGLAPSLPGIVLVVVIVWALAAVLMLTGTLVNAREIDNTLPLINAQVLPIDEDLDNVELAEETARLTERIRVAAAPLSDQADRIIVEARKIDRNAASILVTARAINDTATTINETATTINGNVLAINDTVSAISGNVVSINGTVNSIGANVFSINGRVSRVGGNVATINRRVTRVLGAVGPAGATDGGSIKASVDSILGTFEALEPETRSIDTGVAAINGRADVGIDLSDQLKSDFTPIRALVGPGLLGAAGHSTDGIGAIHGHANSIDCSALINSLGPTQYCGR